MLLTDKPVASGQWPVTSKVLVLLDDKPGHSNQALGVAEKLGLPFETVNLEYSVFSKLPNILLGRSLIGLSEKSKQQIKTVASGKWQAVISCGRRTAPVARWIKKSTGAKLVHIMNPEAGFSEFDLIALPAHDKVPDTKNIFRLVTAPHRLTEEKLSAETDKWSDKFSSLKKPIIGVLVGGETKNGKFSKAEMGKFGKLLSSFTEKSGGSLVIVTSRRTGREAEEWLAASVTSDKWQVASKKSESSLYPYDASAPNPYLATIALADMLVVTGDSVSMVSEACYSGKQVLVYSGLAAVSEKHKSFLQNLHRLDMIQPLDENSVLNTQSHIQKNYDSAKELAAYIKTTL